ncbi:MAG: helix-turn-helix transcriptional regulator [Muribaculaceae bacterium]|nr:helix-turn-helix transcriptional regulator [Muribaculaceae bacterium]
MLLISDALDVLYGKWKLRILMTIVRGHIRYKDIMERNPGLTDKILSHNLRSLMDDGLIERVVSTVGAFSRLMVAYRLTPHGASLHPLLDALARWGAEHRKYVIDGDSEKK